MTLNRNSPPQKTVRVPALAAITGAMLILGAALLLILWPMQRREFGQLRRQWQSLAKAGEGYRFAADNLLADIGQAQATNALLTAEVAYWAKRRNTFFGVSPLAQFSPAREEGRIDFKVALYNARTGLVARAGAAGVAIPEDLGLDENISADTRVETALGQLSATVMLVERVLASGIPAITALQPLPPEMTRIQYPDRPRLREYPIAISLTCSFGQALSLLSLLADDNGGFALKEMALEGCPNGTATNLSMRLLTVAGRPLPESGPR